MNAPAIVVWLALAAVVAVWLATRAARSAAGRQRRRLGEDGCCTSGLSGGRLACCRSRWLAITRRGTCILPRSDGRSSSASRSRPRGRRASSATWRRAVAASAALVLLGYIVPLCRARSSTGARWPTSRTPVSARRQGRRAVGAPGSLIVVGAPGRSWEWALPFAVRPPYQRTDLRDRVFIISPRALSCCTGPWFEETRQTIRAWSSGGSRDSAVRIAVGSADRERCRERQARTLPSSSA